MKYKNKITTLIWAVCIMAKNAMGQNHPNSNTVVNKTDSSYTLLNKDLSDVVIKAKGKKLPNVQLISLHAPDNIKIDGLSTEWNSRFQAYNKETGIYYTIANDNDNLYVIIHATNPRIITKMMEGGISFTVGDKKETNSQNSVTVLFPVLGMLDCEDILQIAGIKIDDDPYKFKSQKPAKSVSINDANTKLINNLKEIKISGIKSITDTIVYNRNEKNYYSYLPLRFHPFQLIPVQNKYNIKAITQFDKKGAYNYELSIPLSYIKTFINSSSGFRYNITLNGRGLDTRLHNQFSYQPNKNLDLYNEDLEYSTDFWAEYTLAK